MSLPRKERAYVSAAIEVKKDNDKKEDRIRKRNQPKGRKGRR